MDEGRPKSIALIVEDDHDLLQLTAMLLQEGGFDTVECESARARHHAPGRPGRDHGFRGYTAFRCDGWRRLGTRVEDALAASQHHSHLWKCRGATCAPTSWGRVHGEAMATSQCSHGRGTGKIVIAGAFPGTWHRSGGRDGGTQTARERGRFSPSLGEDTSGPHGHLSLQLLIHRGR